MNATAHETIRMKQPVEAPVAEVWDAYRDPAKRAKWSVPAGEALVYDKSGFHEGGRDHYRCGPAESLDFHVEAEYMRIVPHELIVYAETVKGEGRPLATELVTWQLQANGIGTLVTVTSQVVSFVGARMIDGNRRGHTKALEQLAQLFAEEQSPVSRTSVQPSDAASIHSARRSSNV